MFIKIYDDEERLMGAYRLAGTDPDGPWELFSLNTDIDELSTHGEVMLPRRGTTHDSLLAAVGFAVDDATAA